KVGIKAAINGTPTICLDETNVGNYATTSLPGQTIQWTVSGGGISGLDNQPDVNVIWTSLPGTVTLTVTDTLGCTDTEVFTVIDSCNTQVPCNCEFTPNFTYK